MGDHALAGRLDLSEVGISHSFGAVTTQADKRLDLERNFSTLEYPRSYYEPK